ncbi:MAG: response regulator [bacterium]
MMITTMPDRRSTILLVEDNPDDELLAVRALKKHHVANEVVVARDGVAALAYLAAAGERAARGEPGLPQVVLLDLKLPKLDGREVLERIRKDAATRTLPVVILTSSREEQDIAETYRLGANSFIRKPVDFDQFSESIRQLGLYWLVLNEPPPDTLR